MTFLGETENFSAGRIGALRWRILVGKQKHNVQKPRWDLSPRLVAGTSHKDYSCVPTFMIIDLL